jgi:hypothetical protein
MEKGWKNLYVGGDESNHGNRKKKGEIIVAVFSTLDEDKEIVKLGNKRDYSEALSYASKEGRDWLFTIRAGDQYFGKNNLPLVIPTLLQYYLEKNQNLCSELKEISVFIDGELRKKFIEDFKKDIRNVTPVCLEKVVVKGFTKKRFEQNGFSKGYECPKLIWAADSIANYLLSKCSPIQRLFEHPKMIHPLIDI